LTSIKISALRAAHAAATPSGWRLTYAEAPAMTTVDLLKHARAAVLRATMDLDQVRRELKDATGMSRPHRLTVEEEVLELTRQLSVLTDRFDEMTKASADDLPSVWRHFLVAYDDYLEAVRRAKCARANEEYLDDLSVTAQASGDEAHQGA
jgi:hypothetical protein